MYIHSCNERDLVGVKVISAKINPANDLIVLETDAGTYYLSWEGDCCARCYLANVSGSAFLSGATILEMRHDEWTAVSSDEAETVESMGTTIKTNKGYVNFSSRVEHNGYYGGYVTILRDSPIPLEYLRECRPLRDF